MKTQVEFRSSKFPPYEGEEEEINPGLWGRRLAEYLVDNLTAKGVEPEDWGYYIPLKNEAFRLGLGCGHQNGDDDEFLCFTDPDKPVIRKFLRTIDATPQLTKLTLALKEILESDPEIREIVWTKPR
jgi:hypothetical protein